MGLMDMFRRENQDEEIKKMIQDGAVIIDVRSPMEFQGGHVAGSKNIPLPEIQFRMDEIEMIDKPIVLCCASGARSGQAERFLKSKGISCKNGGGWLQVNGLL